MKKIALSIAIVFLLIFSINVSMAKIITANNSQAQESSNTNEINNVVQQVENKDSVTELVDMKENEKKSIDYYTKKYGSETYGFTAYILNKVRIYSIPLCFLGIAISAVYQYVLGVRKLDVRDKGFGIMIAVVTVLVICQVLPLVFAVVVKGWRG